MVARTPVNYVTQLCCIWYNHCEHNLLSPTHNYIEHIHPILLIYTAANQLLHWIQGGDTGVSNRINRQPAYLFPAVCNHTPTRHLSYHLTFFFPSQSYGQKWLCLETVCWSEFALPRVRHNLVQPFKLVTLDLPSITDHLIVSASVIRPSNS